MKNSGFELEVRFNKVLNNGMRFWTNANYTYAHNEIILKDDPALIPSYRKAQGYSQGYTQEEPKQNNNDDNVVDADFEVVDD